MSFFFQGLPCLQGNCFEEVKFLRSKPMSCRTKWEWCLTIFQDVLCFFPHPVVSCNNIVSDYDLKEYKDATENPPLWSFVFFCTMTSISRGFWWMFPISSTHSLHSHMLHISYIFTYKICQHHGSHVGFLLYSDGCSHFFQSFSRLNMSISSRISVPVILTQHPRGTSRNGASFQVVPEGDPATLLPAHPLESSKAPRVSLISAELALIPVGLDRWWNPKSVSIRWTMILKQPCGTKRRTWEQ